MDKQRTLSILAFCACLFALCVIGLGAFTRLIDAGLGCPDWPGCYGHLTVPLNDAARTVANTQFPNNPFVNYKAWAEMIHRYAVGGLSLFIISIACWVFSNRQARVIKNILAVLVLLSLLSYQIILGQLTVTLKLLPVIVSQHLLGGFLILSVLWLIYLMNRQGAIVLVRTSLEVKNRGLMLVMAMIALLLVFSQISLGAWTSTNYASLSCPDFPFCMNNNIHMPMQFKEAFNLFSPIGINYDGGVLSESVRQTIQMTHRLGALIVTLYLFVFAIIALPRFKDFSAIIKIFYVILGLLCVQLCIGMANVIFKLPLATAILHNVMAVLLLLAVIALIFKIITCSRKVSIQ